MHVQVLFNTVYVITYLLITKQYTKTMIDHYHAIKLLYSDSTGEYKLSSENKLI